MNVIKGDWDFKITKGYRILSGLCFIITDKQTKNTIYQQYTFYKDIGGGKSSYIMLFDIMGESYTLYTEEITKDRLKLKSLFYNIYKKEYRDTVVRIYPTISDEEFISKYTCYPPNNIILKWAAEIDNKSISDYEVIYTGTNTIINEFGYVYIEQKDKK